MRGRGRAANELRVDAGRQTAREAGLEPAGHEPSYFQFWPMHRTRLSGASEITRRTLAHFGATSRKRRSQ
jgi:hypothetical protein